MSPRAAWRLVSLGYELVYDYGPGKADWLSFGLPYEGSALLAGQVLTDDVPTCSFRDRLGDVRETLEASRYGLLVALDGDGVVLGLLDRGALSRDDGLAVERVMREGPTTVRPSEELGALAGRMRRAEVDAILVTRSDGRLLGLLERARAERAIEETSSDAHR